jgi:hypothetical protein
MLTYLKNLLCPHRPEPQPNPLATGLSEKALREHLETFPIDQPLLTLDFDTRKQKDCYPAITGGYIVPNGLVLDTPGGRQLIKRTIFRRIKVRQDTATTGTVFLEADQDLLIKLAGLRNSEEVGNVLGALALVG